MKASIRWLLALGFVLLAAAVLLRTYVQLDREPAQDEDGEQESVKVPPRVSVTNGETLISLDAATQTRMGIVVAQLQAVNAKRQEPAAARVLATDALVPLRNGYVMAEAQLQKAQAQLAVASGEYERLRNLYDDNRNISRKELEAARGALETDRANVDAARKGLSIASSAVQQSWGAVVDGWVAKDSPELASVLSQQAVLVQLTLPPGTSVEAPTRITLSTPAGRTADAEYVSPFPQVDPRIQGISELYLARAYPLLEPGMNLMAQLPMGERRRGVLIPHSAVVWWQGEAWVYEQVSPGRFVRKEAPADTPLPGGYLAATGFSAGSGLVVRGAQFLLSEEFRSQIQPED